MHIGSYPIFMQELPTMAVRFRLAELLDEKGLNQSELAKRARVSLVTINAIANNRTAQVRLVTLDEICRALDCEPGELLERTARGRRGR